MAYPNKGLSVYYTLGWEIIGFLSRINESFCSMSMTEAAAAVPHLLAG